MHGTEVSQIKKYAGHVLVLFCSHKWTKIYLKFPIILLEHFTTGFVSNIKPKPFSLMGINYIFILA